MVRIAVVDYDSGNVKSVCKAISYLGHEAILTNKKETIVNADGVILPGVGAFGDCMDKLKRYGVADVLYEVFRGNKPFLGICVGLQLLFEKSYEFGEQKGLGVVRGEVRRFPSKRGFKIPHMGWDNVFFKDNKLFYGLKSGEFFYFVHSYYASATDEVEIASCDYIVEFTASVNKGNVWGVQFHPEKSQKVGLKVLENFCKICEGNL